jgi:phage-related protein
MKVVEFLGDSQKALREFPTEVRQNAGRQLVKVQRGQLPEIGKGVEEIRIWEETGSFRVMYVATFEEAVYVLHAFQKKTQTTSKRDIATAKLRFKQLMRGDG